MSVYLHRLLKCKSGLAALEFVALAPALLLLVFSILVYSLYFSAFIGVRQAAAEGARAAVAGLSSEERMELARTRAQQVVDNYGTLLGDAAALQVTTTPDGTGRFAVRVSYDMSSSPLMRYGSFVPLPSPTLDATVTVTNGSY